ncbi:MAG: BBE domain-containing protein [Chloroflexota bacterium]
MVRHSVPYNVLIGNPSSGSEGEAYRKALAVYGHAKLERRMAVKRRYDPENLFRINHNIPPMN